MCVGSKRLVVGMTGASGAIYGVRLMQILHRMDHVETHLVISDAPALPFSTKWAFLLPMSSCLPTKFMM